jgi:beta-glucosidase-like glycosyl hydrolase
MDSETLVSPAAETQNPAAEEPLNTPEVAEPEVDTPEQAQEDRPDEADKSLKRMERRIQRLTAAKYQTQAEAQQAKAEADALRQKLAQYEQPEEKAGPDPIALAREIAKIEKIAERSNTIAREGAKRFQAFDKAVQAVAREIGPLFDQVGRTTGLGEAVLSADDPAAVLHAIGTDPDLAGELSEMTTIQQVRRIARLETELGKTPEPKASTAPKPIAPVKGAGGGNKDPSQMSDAEFAQWRRDQIKARRGY